MLKLDSSVFPMVPLRAAVQSRDNFQRKEIEPVLLYGGTDLIVGAQVLAALDRGLCGLSAMLGTPVGRHEGRYLVECNDTLATATVRFQMTSRARKTDAYCDVVALLDPQGRLTKVSYVNACTTAPK